MPKTLLNVYQRVAHSTRHQVEKDGWRMQTPWKKPGIKLCPSPQHFYYWVLSSHTHKKMFVHTERVCPLKVFPAQRITTHNERKSTPPQVITTLGVSSETWKTKLYLMLIPAKEKITSSWTENRQISSKILVLCPWQKTLFPQDRKHLFDCHYSFYYLLFTICIIASQE